MKVTVTFDVSDKYRNLEGKCEKAQELLDSIIYDYQIGMCLMHSVHVVSPKFDTIIYPSNE